MLHRNDPLDTKPTGTQAAPLALLFRIDLLEEVGRWSYAIPAYSETFAAILQADAAARERFRVLSGDLLLHSLADRVSAASFTGKRLRHGFEGVSMTKTFDRQLYMTLVWDLCDALQQQWLTVDTTDLARQLLRLNLFAIGLSAVSPQVITEIDASLRQHHFYIGAFLVDAGNPLQQSVTVGCLPPECDYVDRMLLFDPWRSEDPFDPPSLARADEWWSDLAFREVRYATEDERLRAPGWPESPLSDRGILSAQILAQCRRPTHLERVADELFDLDVDPETPTFQVTVDAMPRAEDAIVEKDKLTAYVLNPEHADGRHKAQLFRDLLGIERNDWKFLADQLKAGLSEAPVISRLRSTENGVMYHVITPVQGRNGKVMPVLSAWEVKPSQAPRLTTAYIARGIAPNEFGPAPPVRVLPADLAGEERWEALWSLANEIGLQAMTQTVPVPMLVVDESEPQGTGEWVVEGMFGSAEIVIADLRKGFARWLASSGHASRHPGRGAVVHAPATGVQRAEAYAQAFATVLELHDVPATVVVRLY